ncbi:RHS repeat-associated core domain-containing protein, partial [Lonsdalea quercina]|uniref:RHS repeat-associated core domain-containing protein n=1 Tax=Lonsdalea quercina TaxID=71657 RepID=UPI00397642E8
YDAETGLYYNRHRYYDADSGQYISPDPIGLAGGLRPQGYVHNPLEWVDPLGLSRCPPEKTRVRHYTNRKGSNAIEESGVIKAHDNNRVYVEPAKNKPLSSLEAEKKYQIGRGRGRDYIETDVPTDSLEWVRNPRYHTDELTIKGDVKLDNPKIFRRK